MQSGANMNTTSAVHDIDEAGFGAQVLGAGAPVLVEYWAEWCAPCRMMAPLLEESARLYGDRITVARVNVDDNPGLASRYQVRSIPTLMMFRDGVPVATQVGATNRSRLEQLIETQLPPQGEGAPDPAAPSTGSS
jgi:thioredoxin 1